MDELEHKISILIQEQQPITESEAQDLAHFICELPEIKAIQQEPLVSHVALRRDGYKKLDENTAKELIDMIVGQSNVLNEEFEDYKNYSGKTKKGVYGYECKQNIYYNCEMLARYLYKEIVRAKQSG
jgi:hypothetical protein